MKISLIVATYNNPAYLYLTLKSIMNQRKLPDEVIIADDGSGDDTRLLIEEMAAESFVPMKHVWHPDEGFRLGAIRNKAIAEAEGDYIIQIDGDIILHPGFIADHMAMAKRGWFHSGSRVMLSHATTATMLDRKTVELPKNAPERKKINGCRCPLLMHMMRRYKKSRGGYVRGCNMAFWRDDLIKVNGYNEDINGWGREDSELAYRLINAGIQKGFIKFGAIEYHLDHPENSKDNDARNISLMEQARMSGNSITVHGIRRIAP
ncbi:MAG: glycosyltransferase [Bacteroidales bacterium]|nr:glycosyltransferase [Bacteroidales bacterium]